MRAMVLSNMTHLEQDPKPLQLLDMPRPVPGKGEVLLKVNACGICHTELDEIEGRTPPPHLPVIPGHQVVGRVAGFGPGERRWREGDRLGAAWIFSTCGKCPQCLAGNENLCTRFRGTGRDVNGGYAEYMTISQDFVFPIPEMFSDTEAAPLLCAGAIGYRSLKLTSLRDGQILGLTGFGASGHLTLKLARHLLPHSPVFIFARSKKEQDFARELGADWAGDTTTSPPTPINAIIDTTPVWKPALEALKNLASGGRLVINAIRKEDLDREILLGLDYARHLWMEKEIKSVANVTRSDVQSFLELAAFIPIKPEHEILPLEDANRALVDLKEGKIKGAKVLVVD